MNKNDIIELTIDSISSDGNGVGKYGGMAVFVPNTAAGDVISCKIVKVCKSYCFGIAEKIITSSHDRTENNACPVSSRCGGCVFHHIDYTAELRAKDNIVRNAFKRIGGLNIPFEDILGCNSPERYRNKAQYPLTRENGKTVCGFYAPRSHRVIPCGDCVLQPVIFSEIAEAICSYIDSKGISLYNEESGKGLIRHIYLRRGFHSGEIMVCIIVTAAKMNLFYELGDILIKKFPDIKSFMLNINPKNTNVITGEKCIVLKGKEHITDIMCGKKINISPLSFYQVNTEQAERLYDTAREYAGLKGTETLLDLYCGAGTIGLSMSDGAEKIIGGEIIPQAVENAIENAEINNITNCEFICGDSGKIASELADKNIHPDVIVIDPPRKGADELTLSSIVKMSPERVVMISCNPATAARDTAYLCNNGYKAVRARAVDLFPRTCHVECVVLMSRAKN